MNKKIALAGLIVVFALTFVSMIRLSQNKDVTIPLIVSSQQNMTNLSTVMIPTNQSTGSKQDQFSQHSTVSDCWILYQNKIYDITSYLPRHPGGEQKIAQFCGKPGFEEAFLAKHGTSKVATLMKVGVLIGDFDIKGVGA